MNDELDQREIENTQAAPEVIDEQQEDDTVDYWKAQAEKFKNEAAQANKAFREVKARPSVPTKEVASTPKKEDELSSWDVLALSKGNYEAEDIDFLRKAAKIEGKPIRDILNDKDISALLANRQSERRSANAVPSTERRGTAGRSGEALRDTALSTGELPDSDAELAKLISAYNKKR